MFCFFFRLRLDLSFHAHSLIIYHVEALVLVAIGGLSGIYGMVMGLQAIIARNSTRLPRLALPWVAA
jgi:hypothetical protein